MVVLSDRSDLHLSELQRVTVTTKSFPVDSVGVTLMWSGEIETVEVRVMTGVVPPSSFIQLRTVIWASVIVSVKRREIPITLKVQRISYTRS